MSIFLDQSFYLSSIAALLIGFSKSGIPNTGVLSVVLMVSFLPPQFSLAVLLPLLLLGDINALYYYKKHINYKEMTKVLKVVFLGMLLGGLVFFCLKEKMMKKYIAFCLFFISSFKLCSFFFPNIENLFRKLWRLFAFFGGTFTVGSHTGGPFIAMGLLCKQHSKESFLALYAATFFIVNLLKVPLFLFSKSLTLKTLTLSLMVSPIVFLGAFLGYRLVPFLSIRTFNLLTSLVIFFMSLTLIVI
ncbi:MAG: sulfite exporter TauE/SafE family protein [Chlamydiales bacterium]|nr:sulfite exporter TauE/SafE family protein [Chlamydiales bacterium]